MAGFAKKNTRLGFAQVEPNHLSGIVTGQIYAQYPADLEAMGEVLEQGRFAKYDGVNQKVNLTGNGEWMLIYNEEKLPDERKQNHKDFALKAVDMTDKIVTPRLIKTNIGDIYTTNAIGEDTLTVQQINALSDASVAKYSVGVDDEINTTYPIGTLLYVSTNGYLGKTKGEDYEGPVFEVIKPFAGAIATMPDGQPAVKIMRIK